MAYAETSDLAPRLNLRGATATAKEADLQRVLDAASLEIDHEIAGPLVSPTEEEAALLMSVCLARAQDLWTVEQQPIGVIGLGGETPLLAPRDSWVRHANALAPLKPGDAWGVA